MQLQHIVKTAFFLPKCRKIVKKVLRMRILRRGLARFCPHGRLDKMRFARAAWADKRTEKIARRHSGGVATRIFPEGFAALRARFCAGIAGGYAGVSLDAAEKARFIASPKWRGGKFKLFARGETRGYMNMQPIRFAKPARPAAPSPIRLLRGVNRRMLRILPRAAPRPPHFRRRESPRRILP